MRSSNRKIYYKSCIKSLNIKNMKLKVLLFFVSAIALASCVDIPDFSDTPRIFYNGIDQERIEDPTGDIERVTITIDFEDGDGDIGVSDDERNDTNFTGKYGSWGDCELVTMQRLTNGTWTESILSVDKYKWMPLLKKDGKPGPLKGKIDINTKFYWGSSVVPVTVKFKVRIRDRALRISNQIMTDSIIVPGYNLYLDLQSPLPEA